MLLRETGCAAVKWI